jgi:hypothetical protein
MLKKILKFTGSVILLLLASCSFNEPVLPTWMVPLNIPLSGEVFKLREIVNDSTLIVNGPDSLIFISVDGELDSTGLSREDLSIPPSNETGAIKLGLLKFDSFNVPRTEIKNLRALLPGLSGLVGQTIIIPEQTLLDLNEVVESDEFKRVHAKSGTVTLRLFNNLPFPIGPNNSTPEGIQISVQNDSLNDTILQLNFDEVIDTDELAEVSDQIDPEGQWIYSRLRLNYNLPVAEPTVVFVTDSLLDSTGFWLEVDLENFEADTAVAIIDDQRITDILRLKFDNENKIKRGEIDKGRVQLEFINNLDLTGKIKFTLPNIRTPLDEPFSDSLEVPENGSSNYDIILDHFTVVNPNNPDEFIDSLLVDFELDLSSSQNFVTLTNNDSINVHIVSDSIYLKSFVGYFSLDTLTIPTIEENNIADYEDIPTGIFLQNAQVDVSLLSEILVENLMMNVKITGYHEDENGVRTDSAHMEITRTFTSHGYPGNPDLLNLTIEGPEVANFINILPTSVKANGTLLLEGNAELDRTSQLFGDYNFTTPLRIKIVDLNPIRSKIDTIDVNDLDNDAIDLTNDYIENGTLFLTVSNHTPLEANVEIYVSKDSTHTKDSFFDSTDYNPEYEFVKSHYIFAAPTDPISGFVNNPLESEVNLPLSNQEISILTNPPYMIGFRLKVTDSPGVISFRSTDYIKVFGSAKLSVKVEDN